MPLTVHIPGKRGCLGRALLPHVVEHGQPLGGPRLLHTGLRAAVVLPLARALAEGALEGVGRALAGGRAVLVSANVCTPTGAGTVTVTVS